MSVSIKIVTFGTFPFGEASSNILRNLAMVLSENFKVEVLLPCGYTFGRVEHVTEKRVNQLNGFEYRHLGLIKRPSSIPGKFFDVFLGRVNLVVFLLKSVFLKKPDFIVVYSISFFSNLFFLLFCRLFKIRLVNILSEFYPRPVSFGWQRFKWYSFFLGIKHLAKYSHGIIALSTYLRNYVLQQGFSGKIMLLPNIVDPSSFELEAKPFKAGWITVGYAGTPTVKDGIKDLLESFALARKKIDRLHLLIIGDTAKRSSIPRLKQRVSRLGLDNCVSFTGLVAFHEIPALLNSCDILVLARPAGIQAEAGFPTKLGEYMACRKPVLITRVGDIRTYFADNNAVKLVEPGDPASIALGLEELATDPERRREIAENGWSWMMANLSRQSVKPKIEDFLSSFQEKVINKNND